MEHKQSPHKLPGCQSATSQETKIMGVKSRTERDKMASQANNLGRDEPTRQRGEPSSSNVTDRDKDTVKDRQMREVLEGIQGIIHTGRVIFGGCSGNGNTGDSGPTRDQPGEPSQPNSTSTEETRREILGAFDGMERVMGRRRADEVTSWSGNDATNLDTMAASLPTNCNWDSEGLCVRFTSAVWSRPASSAPPFHNAGTQNSAAAKCRPITALSSSTSNRGQQSTVQAAPLETESSDSRYNLRNRQQKKEQAENITNAHAAALKGEISTRSQPVAAPAAKRRRTAATTVDVTSKPTSSSSRHTRQNGPGFPTEDPPPSATNPATSPRTMRSVSGKKRKRASTDAHNSAAGHGSEENEGERSSLAYKNTDNEAGVNDNKGLSSGRSERLPQRVFIWIGDRRIIREEDPTWKK